LGECKPVLFLTACAQDETDRRRVATTVRHNVRQI